MKSLNSSVVSNATAILNTHPALELTPKQPKTVHRNLSTGCTPAAKSNVPNSSWPGLARQGPTWASGGENELLVTSWECLPGATRLALNDRESSTQMGPGCLLFMEFSVKHVRKFIIGTLHCRIFKHHTFTFLRVSRYTSLVVPEIPQSACAFIVHCTSRIELT